MGADTPPPGRAARPFRVPPAARWVLFLVLLGLWTWGLLEPNPVPEAVRTGLAALDLEFVAQKATHASVYALLTALGMTLRPARWWPTAAVAFMALHGAGTELGQYLMAAGRHGCVRDVLIDWAGIALGAWALRRWQSRR